MPIRPFSPGLLLIALAAASSAAQARPVAQLQALVAEQLARVPGAVDACELAPQGGGDVSWDAVRFFLDEYPYVSVGVGDVAAVQVTPEFLFVWSRAD